MYPGDGKGKILIATRVFWSVVYLLIIQHHNESNSEPNWMVKIVNSLPIHCVTFSP